MAWIAVVPPSSQYPSRALSDSYRDGERQRSVGISPTMRRALAEQRVVERPAVGEVDL
jgi:hypothetical protein